MECFSLSGSMQSSRCKISGVRGIGSLPLLPHDHDPTLALETELKLISRSLSLPSVPMPSGASDAYVILCSVAIIPTVGCPLRALVGMVKVGRGPKSSLGTCLIGVTVALLMLSSIVSGRCKPGPLGGSSICPCFGIYCASSSMASFPHV